MVNATVIDDLAKRLSDLVPSGAREAHEEMLGHFREALRAGLRRFDLVTREEFDVQRCVLMRTREKVEALETRVSELETSITGRSPSH